jgi:hypothetical protein
MSDDPLSGQWKIITLKCTEPYRPEILFQEDGLVDRGDLRNPRDGERFVILIQEIQEDERTETEARIKKFIAETRWRRLKSRYKIATFHFDASTEESEEPSAEFESVEKGIRRKHTRYRARFKQRKKILTQSVDDSPLIQFTFLDDDDSGRSSAVLDELVETLDRSGDQGAEGLQGEIGGEGGEIRRLGRLQGIYSGTGRAGSGQEMGFWPELVPCTVHGEMAEGPGSVGPRERGLSKLDLGPSSVDLELHGDDPRGLVKDTEILIQEGETSPDLHASETPPHEEEASEILPWDEEDALGDLTSLDGKPTGNQDGDAAGRTGVETVDSRKWKSWEKM